MIHGITDRSPAFQNRLMGLVENCLLSPKQHIVGIVTEEGHPTHLLAFGVPGSLYRETHSYTYMMSFCRYMREQSFVPSSRDFQILGLHQDLPNGVYWTIDQDPRDTTVKCTEKPGSVESGDGCHTAVLIQDGKSEVVRLRDSEFCHIVYIRKLPVLMIFSTMGEVMNWLRTDSLSKPKDPKDHELQDSLSRALVGIEKQIFELSKRVAIVEFQTKVNPSVDVSGKDKSLCSQEATALDRDARGLDEMAPTATYGVGFPYHVGRVSGVQGIGGYDLYVTTENIHGKFSQYQAMDFKDKKVRQWCLPTVRELRFLVNSLTGILGLHFWTAGEKDEIYSGGCKITLGDPVVREAFGDYPVIPKATVACLLLVKRVPL